MFQVLSNGDRKRERERERENSSRIVQTVTREARKRVIYVNGQFATVNSSDQRGKLTQDGN